MRRALAAAGHQVAGFAPSVEAALTLAEGVVPEVAVVARDLGRCGDGVEAVRLLRERHGCLSVLTADRLDDDAARAAGAAAFILRGFGSRALLAAIDGARAEVVQRDGAARG